MGNPALMQTSTRACSVCSIHRSHVLSIILGLVTMVSSWVVSPVASGAAAPPREVLAIREHADPILDDLAETGDFVQAGIELERVLDGVLAHMNARRPDAYIEIVSLVRMVEQLGAANHDDAMALLPFLRQEEAFRRAIVFAARPDAEGMDDVYALVRRLVEERPKQVAEYVNLAAAIAVVHDRPLQRRINENTPKAPDPLLLFDYYIAHEDKMLFGIENVPTELLVYVVDVTASIPELLWALQQHAGDPMIGARFFDIQYDYDHYRTGAPKKSTLAGWGLPNIARYGGVCADQAYYAVTAGKAIGVPTAYTIGRDADVSHAWVGFLQANRRDAFWNFDIGRYESYQNLRGIIFDPQIRQPVADSSVKLLADFAMSDDRERYAAMALTDFARRLRTIETSGAAWHPEPIIETSRSRGGKFLREPTIDHQLELLEQGLRSAPAYAPGWLFLSELARDGALTMGQKERWADVLTRLCGREYPDFSIRILKAMIESVEDVEKQNSFWNAVFRQYQGRPDISAQIRMSQGRMWEAAGDLEKAGQCYTDVIGRYANAGPFIMGALANAERLLKALGREDQILPMYAQAWSMTKAPEDMAGVFATQSNWYRVGRKYAEALQGAGLQAESRQVAAVLAQRAQ